MTVETLALVGAVTGIVGALTGVISLVWQIITHRQSGRLVKVTCTNMYPVFDALGASEVGDHMVGIQVINRGGAPVTVTGYGVATDGKRGQRNLFVTAPPAWATPLPTTVQPGGEPPRLLVPTAELRRLHAEEGIAYEKMRPWVTLGDGRQVYSKHVPLK